MPEDVQGQGQQGQGQGGGTEPAPAPDQAQQQDQQQQQGGGQDHSSFYQKARNDERQAQEASQNKWLQDTFGTTDRAEIEQRAKASQGKDKQTNDDVARLTKQVEELTRQNNQIQNTAAEQVQRTSVLAELALTPVQNAQDALGIFLGQYDVREVDGRNVVFNKGSDVPAHFDEKGTQLDVKAVLKKWREDPSLGKKYLFTPQTQQSHVSGQGGQAGGNLRKLSPEELSNPVISKAVEQSGQLEQVYAGQPVDMDKLNAYLKPKEVGKLA